jgi:hypothetical protein
MTMPGFTADATLGKSGNSYRITVRPWNEQQRVIPQSRLTCAFKAGRLAGRCLGLGHDPGDCYAAAADFNTFCNDYDL